MKTLILFVASALVLLISSCNQNSPAPSNSGSSNNTTPTPTTTMTATEAALVGDWIWDKTENYNSGVLTSITTSTTLNGYYANTHMNLKSAIYTNNSANGAPNSYQGDFYSGTQAASGQWVVITDQFGKFLTTSQPIVIGGQGYITTLTSTNLVLESGYNPTQIPNGGKSYYHK